MNGTNPFFSIIIPTYNREKLIGATLQSILRQTFINFEVIVVDDGSRDSTEAVVLRMNSSHISYYRKENGERGAARNFGIERARGRYITFIDSDDVLYPDHFETAYQFLCRRDEVNCYAQAYEIKNVQTGAVITRAHISTSELINKQVIEGNFLSCFGIFVKREVLKEIKFEEERKFAGTEDWLLWLQLAARYPFYYNNEVTGAMLEHDSRSVLSFDEDSLLFRTEFLRNKLENDLMFIQKFGIKSVTHIYAHMLSYSSLHLAMSRKKKKAFQYWIKAVKSNIGELFTRRCLAIAKKLIFS